MVHSKTVIFEMKAHFLDYVATCGNVQNRIVALRSSTVQDVSIYSEYEGASRTFISEQQTNIYMNERVAREFRTFWADLKSIGALTDVLEWYQ